VASCIAIYEAYDAVKGPGCKKCKSKAEAESNAAKLTLEVAGRAAYIQQKCDYCLSDSIARGSANAENGHKIQLAEKAAALAKCISIIAGF